MRVSEGRSRTPTRQLRVSKSHTTTNGDHSHTPTHLAWNAIAPPIVHIARNVKNNYRSATDITRRELDTYAGAVDVEMCFG
jgi:hypothetical protein